MTSQDRTQMVTVRVQVPTFSAAEAAKKYLPAIIDAIDEIEVLGTTPLRIRGASIGIVR